MTNQQFVTEWLTGKREDRRHRNLLVRNGILFSYGEHFPLAWEAYGVCFLNTSRYSQTTTRHQGLVRRAAWQLGVDIIADTGLRPEVILKSSWKSS